MAAMIAAITPRKIVPCRVVNSLLDVMFSTAIPPSNYLVKTGTQFPNAPRLHGEPFEIPPGFVYLIQWPQTDPSRDLSFPQPFFPPWSGDPSGHSFTFSAFMAAP